MTTVIIIAVVAAVLLCALTYFITASKFNTKIHNASSERDQALADKDKEIARRDTQIEYLNKSVQEAEVRGKEAVEQQKQLIEHMKEDQAKQKEMMDAQINAIKAQLVAENEKNLKQREEELSKKAKETFESISGGIGKDLEKMAKAFEESQKTQTATTAELKERLANTVKNLEDQTNKIGERADNLANALKGEKKIQGCFGEMVLGNILASEGLTEGRDYDKEDTIRTRVGITLTSEEDKRMRPDYILHYPDGSDIIVDAKTPVNALDDYFRAKTDEERKDAAKRNLEAIMNHVKTLSGKDYSGYAKKAGRNCLDYVIMFIPNYGAMQLAKQEKADIWREAFNKYNILITTEETFIPFTRMIRTAWISHDQVRNQAQILAAAQHMIDRVADFSKAHAEMGKKLDDAKKYFDQCDIKLKESGPSIITAANQLIKLGVPANPKKPLPEVADPYIIDSAEESGE